jgi:hypothetical protein
LTDRNVSTETRQIRMTGRSQAKIRKTNVCEKVKKGGKRRKKNEAEEAAAISNS